MSHSLKVICVGTPSELLQSRQFVLQSAGYDTTCVAVSEALTLLLTGVFDFMIISVTVIEGDRLALRRAAGEAMRIVQLATFTDPGELLALLRRP
ncbi:hypothetical protein [Granulicella arctica]|uniref:hypothetical protein n=1 Tax=Granulicella arctica TaxID=940613 RepID=UPI0021DFEF04|nr:hypothetical protein [Granulicella arctica]